MLWRMAFPALVLLFGLLVGYRFGAASMQGDVASLRNAVQVLEQENHQAVQQRHLDKVADQLASEEERTAHEEAKARIRDLEYNHQAELAVAENLRQQLATCHGHLQMTLAGHERLTTVLDNLDKNCSN